jgi:hypothetical protein
MQLTVALSLLRRKSTMPPDQHDESTLPSDMPVKARPTSFPTLDPTCYELGDEVARGSFGRVVSARDRRLDRAVALKVLLERGGSIEARFRREAMVTARLAHPSIVPVYEVGTLTTGELFYAMKLISGRSLREVIGGATSLDERIALLPHVIAAADAVSYAHSQQVIHRDLKPTNIMVGPFGETLVIDWGLAKLLGGADDDAVAHVPRSPLAGDLTSDGAVMGTPAYMAPEQAEGRPVDQRADVYALGAILYSLMCGHAPYGEGESHQIIARVRSGPPAAIEALEPGTPVELVAVVKHAMERDPAARYASAREMVDDLRRFQAGQLVRAHRYSRAVLARRWLFRHPRVVSAALLTLVLLGVALFVSWERRSAALRLRVAQELSALVERGKSRLEVAYLSPLHDTRPTIADIKRQVDGIRAQLAGANEGVRALGLFALARSHMALREFAAARTELEEALRKKEHPTEVPLALGRTLAELYAVELENLGSLSATARADRVRELQRTLRDPALQLLKAAPPGALPTLSRGMLAELENRYDEALALAREAAAEDAASYEARLLEGDVEVDRAEDDRGQGRYAEAKKGYERAAVAYAAAVEVGRSDPFAYLRQCRLGRLLTANDRAVGNLRQEVVDEALEACERARHANPSLAAGALEEARLYEEILDADYRAGRDPRPNMQREAALVEEALRLDPTTRGGEMRLASNLMSLAMWEDNHGSDPRPTLARARQHLEAVIQKGATAEAYHTLGMTYYGEADHIMGRGENPEAPIRLAIAASQRAVEINERAITHNNLASDYLLLAEWELEHGRDPRPNLQSSRHELGLALKINPNYANALHHLAWGDCMEADFEWFNHRDGHRLLQSALADNDRAAKLNPERAAAHLERATVLVQDAEMLLDESGDPKPRLDAARAAIDKAMSIDSDDFNVHQRLAQLELLRARASRSPAAAFAAAEHASAEARRHNPSRPDLLITQAAILRWKAAWQIAAGSDARATVADGLAAVAKALAIAPDANALAVRGALLWEQSQLVRGAARGTAREEARDALAEALRMDALLARRYQPLLDEVRGEERR